MRKVYFARAVDSIDPAEVASSRQKVVDRLASIGCDVINDFSYGYKDANDLVESQLANVRRCDILVADMSIPRHPYIGTIGEIIYAHQFGKPVYVVFGDYTHVKERPWLMYHVDGFFDTFDSLVSFLSG